MKKTLIALALLVPLSATAGDRGDREGPPRMDRVMKQLNLSAEQEAQIKDVFARHHDKMTELREQTEDEVSRILTPEQQAKLDEMKQKRRERRDAYEEKHEQRMGKGKNAEKD